MKAKQTRDTCYCGCAYLREELTKADAEIDRLRALLDAGRVTLEAREKEILQNHEDWKSLRAENATLKEKLASMETTVGAMIAGDLHKENAKLREYIQILRDELRETVGLAYVHGWRSSRGDVGKKYIEELGLPE